MAKPRLYVALTVALSVALGVAPASSQNADATLRGIAAFSPTVSVFGDAPEDLQEDVQTAVELEFRRYDAFGTVGDSGAPVALVYMDVQVMSVRNRSDTDIGYAYRCDFYIQEYAYPFRVLADSTMTQAMADELQGPVAPTSQSVLMSLLVASARVHSDALGSLATTWRAASSMGTTADESSELREVLVDSGREYVRDLLNAWYAAN